MSRFKAIITCIAACAIVITGFYFTRHWNSNEKPISPLSDRLEKLIAESKAGYPPLETSVVLKKATAETWSEEEVKAAVIYVTNNRDVSSYHLLFALEKVSPEAFGQISSEARAKILVSALKNISCLNDWSVLSPTEPYDDHAAKELIATGPAAVSLLLPLLDDTRDAPLRGSAPATASSEYQYRRCDFAYRYLCLIHGKPAPFMVKPSERDVDIAILKKELTTTAKHK
jgi:hypothetical protein